MSLPELAGAAVLVVLLSLFIGRLLRTAFKARRLASLRSARTESNALAEAIKELPAYEKGRVEAAYKWVQDLVSNDGFPIYLDDDIQDTLCVDQGEVDAKLEACYDCYGEELDRGVSASEPLRTVRQLMRAILESGYERYPSAKVAPSRSAA